MGDSPCSHAKLNKGDVMDAVVIGSILAIVGSLIVVVVLAIRIGKLIMTTHSEDEKK